MGMFVHIQEYIADYVAFSFFFRGGVFSSPHSFPVPPHHVLFWSFVYQAFCWRSWLNLGGRISSILSPILIFFSPLNRTKSEHFCGQIGERISGVKIGDAPPKSELLASLTKYTSVLLIFWGKSYKKVQLSWIPQTLWFVLWAIIP